MEELLKVLHGINPLSPELREHLIEVLRYRTIQKRDMLLKAGHVCKHIYFIGRGLLRCYYIKDNTEVCSWFMKEGDVIASAESFFMQTSSYEYIQALEDSELHYISYDDLQYIYKQFPEFNVIGRALAEKYYVLSEQRLFSLRMQRHNKDNNKASNIHWATGLEVTKHNTKNPLVIATFKERKLNHNITWSKFTEANVLVMYSKAYYTAL